MIISSISFCVSVIPGGTLSGLICTVNEWHLVLLEMGFLTLLSHILSPGLPTYYLTHSNNKCWMVGLWAGNCSEQSCAGVFLMISHNRSTIPKVTLLNRTVSREQLSAETVNDFFFFLFEQILTISTRHWTLRRLVMHYNTRDPAEIQFYLQSREGQRGTSTDASGKAEASGTPLPKARPSLPSACHICHALFCLQTPPA